LIILFFFAREIIRRKDQVQAIQQIKRKKAHVKVRSLPKPAVL